MKTTLPTDQFIERLASGLEPVRVLRAPSLRAVLWLAVAGAIGASLILLFAPWGSVRPRLAGPRVMLECVATAATAVCAIFAAFALSMPDRSRRWFWLPWPAFLVWLGASGLGCLRNGFSLGGTGGIMGESPHCFVFITAASVPLAAGLFWMLRRARPIDPLPVAVLGTLGVAASAALLLEFFHPFDVTVIDLSLHLAAVGLVVLVGTFWRRSLLDAGGMSL